MLPFAQILKMRGNDRADGTTIGRSVTMTSDILIDRTGVQAGAATDAIKALPGLLISKDPGPAIIQQDHDHFFRAIRLPGLPGAGDDRIIDGKSLTSAISGQQGPEQASIRQGG